MGAARLVASLTPDPGEAGAVHRELMETPVTVQSGPNVLRGILHTPDGAAAGAPAPGASGAAGHKS